MFTYEEGLIMTTIVLTHYDRIKKIIILTIVFFVFTFISCICNSHMPTHMQDAFVATCEARSEGDIWKDFFRNEFQRVIRNEFDGVRKLRDTRYDILSHNMWERNRWETDYRRMQVQGALAYDGEYVGYVSPRVAELAQQIQQQILLDRQSSGITSGVSVHKIQFKYNTDEQIIRSICATPGCPYRIQKKQLGSKTFYIVFDPSLLS